MLGVSGLIPNNTNTSTATSASVDAAGASAAAEPQESGGTSAGSGASVPAGAFSEDDKARIEEGERAAGGNRWPRQETLALLKIRSDMDVAFRDSSLKGPLWEEVSRKMSELGYHRSSKKCKEKFENVYKYHKRTKDGRSSKPDGKTYRFFDQLEALENSTTPSSSSAHHQLPPPPRPPPHQVATMAVPMQAVHPYPPKSQIISAAHQVTVSSTPNNNAAVSVAHHHSAPSDAAPPPQSFNNFITSSFPPSQTLLPSPPTTTAAAVNVANPPHHGSTVPPPSHQLNISTSFLSTSSSSSTSSDEDIERGQKRKRKWKDYFERLMKDVIERQEQLQKRFLETLEKRERDRMIREEAWRVQEMARINREHDLLVQERSMAAARESALISFLQKVTDQQQKPQNANSIPTTTINTTLPAHAAVPLPPQVQVSGQYPENPLPHRTPPPAAPPASAPLPSPATVMSLPPVTTPVMAPAPIRSVDHTPKSDNGGSEAYAPTSSRWPKAEIEALIKLRTNLDTKYQENGPKGPLWEEISAGMRKLGYNRNAKRCKEKWENINKYFKKVKESNKKRPEDSKTCPYFHQLEALYREKAKGDNTCSTFNSSSANAIRPDNSMTPIMARPEQQWPLPQEQQQQHESTMEEQEGENIGHNDNDDDDDDDDGDGDEDEEDEGSAYEIVTNKPSSVTSTVE